MHSTRRPIEAVVNRRDRETLEGLQILRGLAATGVVLHHILEESRRQLHTPDCFIRVGAAGVDVFFVLSGFIMLYTIPLGRDRVREAKAFLVRRAIRIVPLYWLIVVLIAVMHLTGFFYRSLVLSPGSLVRSLLFLERSHLVLGVSWTLNYEAWFYVIFSIAISFTKSSRLVTLIVGSMLAASILFIGPLLEGNWKLWMENPIAIEFIAGMALGIVHRRLALPVLYKRFLGAFGLIIIFIASQYSTDPNTNGLDGWARLLEWGGGAVMLTSCSLVSLSCLSKFTSGLVLLGDASFAIYLSHPLLMTIYATLLLKSRFGTGMMLVLVCAVTCVALLGGIWTHLYIETPLLRRVKQVPGVAAASVGHSLAST